ncbi:MAG TPA: hypothetical protein VGH34_11295 [Vicinamibacterales bacterium]
MLLIIWLPIVRLLIGRLLIIRLLIVGLLIVWGGISVLLLAGTERLGWHLQNLGRRWERLLSSRIHQERRGDDDGSQHSVLDSKNDATCGAALYDFRGATLQDRLSQWA